MAEGARCQYEIVRDRLLGLALMGSAGFQPAGSCFQRESRVHPARGIPCAGCTQRVRLEAGHCGVLGVSITPRLHFSTPPSASPVPRGDPRQGARFCARRHVFLPIARSCASLRALMSQEYKVKLEVFEGPLDLLLFL